MQNMQEPEGRSYNQGYSESAGNPTSQDDEQARWSQPQYGRQQKVQPEARISTTNFVLAVLGLVTSEVIMGLSIALLALTANIFGKTVAAGATAMLPYGVADIIIGAFVVALILLIFSIAGFVFSTIQLAIIARKRRRARSRARY
ncbi:MAG: hypothetical protein H0V70_00660 [Ktedonobacteraceae bacterium]|nr:hypothetical protein [Ktedonobacteraceae bacterium]